MSFSREKEKILEILKKNEIESLWHFTEIENLPYIRKLDGLRSKEYLEENGYWASIRPGGDHVSHDLDRRLGNWDKISLNFKPYTPMAYRKKKVKHLIFIEINPEIAAYEGVYFTDCNATRVRDSQIREEGLTGLGQVNFGMINCLPEPWNPMWRKYVQAEILVPHHIPICMFKAVHFISEASRKYGESLWKVRCDLFHVNPVIFSDIDKYRKWTIQFSYIKEVLICSRDIPREKMYAIRSNDPHVVQGKLFWIIVHFYAVAGTRISISIDTIRKRKEREIIKEDEGIWWEGFTAPEGVKYLDVKVYIDTMLWVHRIVRCKELEK